MISIAIVDDHQLFRRSLSAFLNSFKGIKVIFDTDDGQAVLDFLKSNQVDVILLDLQMPVMNGYELCKLIRDSDTIVKILIVSQLSTKDAVYRIMDLGANGFLTKNATPEQLESAIKSVMEKDYYFDLELSAVIREAMIWENRSLVKSTEDYQVHFSEREIEIIKLSCKEFSSKEIAEKLFISIRTVEKHRNRIMERTEAKNFIGSILYALRKKHINLDEI